MGGCSTVRHRGGVCGSLVLSFSEPPKTGSSAMQPRAGMLRTAEVKGIAERFAAKTIMWLSRSAPTSNPWPCQSATARRWQSVGGMGLSPVSPPSLQQSRVRRTAIEVEGKG